MRKSKATIFFKTALFLALVSIVPEAGAATAPIKVKPKISSKTSLEVAGWIPYWRKATSTQEAILHMNVFREISPFGYTVKQDGTLVDTMKIDEDPWPAMIETAHNNKVKVIPTVMWSNADAIDSVLRSPKLRRAHVEQIVDIVSGHNFDGVDIDYEGKAAKTKKHFSLFLRDLYKAIGKKLVVCTIEARTPLDSRYNTIPKDIQYANDYIAINKYCDRVRIMTYDQGSIDLKLNDLAEGPYVPVADPQWVEKVVRLAAKTISKKKIFIGIPTYGYEYEVTPLSSGYRYNLLWAFNQKYALDLAESLGIAPQRNIAGEKSFMYTPSAPVISLALATDTVLSNNVSLATTTIFQSATTTATSTSSHILWWSDASAIKEKIVLAKKLGVRGVAIFKIDGGADPVFWEVCIKLSAIQDYKTQQK